MSEIRVNNSKKLGLLLLLGLVLLPVLGIVPRFFVPMIEVSHNVWSAVFLLGGFGVIAYALYAMPREVVFGDDVQFKYVVRTRRISWDGIEAINTSKLHLEGRGFWGQVLAVDERILEIKTRDQGELTVAVDFFNWLELRKFCEARNLPIPSALDRPA